MVIHEIGGTVGDIESLPFLEAARQVRHEIGRDRCFFLHVSLVPYIAPSRGAEDQADAALGRRAAPGRHPARRDRLPLGPADPAEHEEEDRPDMRRRRRRGGRRRRRPVHLRHPEGAARRGSGRLRRAPARSVRFATSTGSVGRTAPPGAPPASRGHRRSGREVHRPTRRLPVGDRGAAFRRVRQRRRGARPLGPVGRVRDAPRAPRRTCTASTPSAFLAGSACAASKARSAPYRIAREHRIPLLGLCLGLQCMVIEYARNVAGLADANSAGVRSRVEGPGHRHDGGPEGHRRR